MVFNSRLAGPTFLNYLNTGLSTNGITAQRTEFYELRNLDENVDKFELTDYLTFTVERGHEDSADIEYLTFDVSTTSIEDSIMNFKLAFKHPLKVSIGARKDVLKITVMDDSFFTSKDDEHSGLSLEIGSTV